MLPVWHHLLEADLELLVYSGELRGVFREMARLGYGVPVALPDSQVHAAHTALDRRH